MANSTTDTPATDIPVFGFDVLVNVFKCVYMS